MENIHIMRFEGINIPVFEEWFIHAGEFQLLNGRKAEYRLYKNQFNVYFLEYSYDGFNSKYPSIWECGDSAKEVFLKALHQFNLRELVVARWNDEEKGTNEREMLENQLEKIAEQLASNIQQ